MDSFEEGVPAFARVRNSVRVVTEPSVGEERMRYIVDAILKDLGHVRREEILAIQDYPRRGVYDVTFVGEGVFTSFWRILSENQKDARLVGYRIFPHFEQEEVVLIIKSYSPNVKLKEVELVLGKFCEKLIFVGRILNGLGIWTSKFRFKAKFKKDVKPPARFQLGTWSLDIFFSGMPAFCKRCRMYGHKEDECTVCRNCGESSHDSKNCRQPKKCNLCFEIDHMYANCPKRSEKPERNTEGRKEDDPSESQVKEIPVEPIVKPRVKEDKLLDKEEKVKVKRKKKQEESIPEQEHPVSSAGKLVKPRGRTRGENLHRYWSDRTVTELNAYIQRITDKEEIAAVTKIIQEGGGNEVIRGKVLEYFKTLK
ncbi:zinc finger CCHC domain-containing protein 3-like [Xenopus laevis]|uniref:Zinc finger CCHC domain-containing protein 3-like n=1 Tax=Xenopus laevis TaxID=8355 RepID=A0A8J1MM59_XENLA|nr:zinc finger CCHC domain-containing protein 3-like [Xenopus laevis]